MSDFGSAKFKERLQAGCHAAVLRNPEWRQQARNTSRNNLRRGFRRLWSWLLTALFASAVAASLGRQALGDELAAPVIGLALGAMTLGLYIISRHRLALACFGHHDLVAFALLPVSDERVIRRQLRKWLRSLPPLGLICVLGFLLAGIWTASGWRLWIGSLAGGTALAFMLAALALCAVRRRWLQRALLAVHLTGWASLLGLRHLDYFWSVAVPWLNSRADQLAWMLPTTWVIRPVQELFQGGPHTSFPLLFPATVLVWYAWWEMRWFIAHGRSRDEVLLHYAAQLPEETPDEVEAEFHQAIDRPPDAEDEEAAACLQTRVFLEPRPRPGDWITRLVWWWWSPRERLLAESAGSNWPRWSRRWLWGAGWMLLGYVAGWLTQPAYPNGWLIAWLLPTVISLMLLLPCRMAWQRWAESGFIGSGTTLWINLFPVTVSEMVRLDRKLTCIRLVSALPVVLLGGLGLASLAAVETHEALSGALLIAGLSPGLRPIMLAILLSNQQTSKPLEVQFADLMMLGMTLLAAGLATSSFIGVVVSDNHGLLMLLPAGLTLLVCDQVGRWSIRLWSRCRLNGVSLGQE